MDKIMKDLINNIQETENFDLRTYYNYIEVYGKETVFKAFDKILLNSNDFKNTYIKYFAAYFSLKLETLEITDDTYLELTEEYGEDVVNNYFKSLLEINNNSKFIKQKYEKIYFYIESLEDSKLEETFDELGANLDDSVRLRLKEIGSYPLLKAEEEATLLQELDSSRKNIEIASFDDSDNINFKNVKKILLSIQTKEQFKKFKKIVNYKYPEGKNATPNDDEDKKMIYEYIESLEKIFRQTNFIKENFEKSYKKEYLDEQLNLMIQFIDSREKLVNSNLRLVVSIAKRYTVAGKYELLDLMSEGNIGLMKAIRRFNCETKNKLSTYATWWIRQGVTRYIADSGRTIRIPVHSIEEINKVNKTKRNLSLVYGEKIPNDVIAEYLGWEVSKVENAIKIENQSNCISYDVPISDDEDTSMLDMMDTGSTTEEIIYSADLKKIINELLETLSEREADVLRDRFGLNPEGKTRTLEEVGQSYGVTRERIRQIENKALRKLRHPSRAKKLKDFYY